MHLKKPTKIGEFLCSYFNTEDGKKYATFWRIMLYYFKKGKNASEIQKKICAVYGEGAMTDQTRQKWFVKFLGAIDIWPDNSLLWGCLRHWKMFSSTPASTH